MKLMLIVETPADENLHGPRIAAALREYIVRSTDRPGSEEDGNLGRDGGPNTMIAANGVRVTERRIDWEFFMWEIGDRIPTFRNAWWWLCSWWFRCWFEDVMEERADGTLIFKVQTRWSAEAKRARAEALH